MKSYNSLLSQAFDAVREQPKIEIPEWLNRSEVRAKKRPIVDLDYDLNRSEIDELLKTNGGLSIRDLILSEGGNHGHDVLAYYKPYSMTRTGDSKNWGIHFRLDAIRRYAAELVMEAKSINPDITYGQLTNFIIEIIRRHELEHAAEEFVGALDQLRSPQTQPTYVASFADPIRRRLSEIVATQQEMYVGGNEIKKPVGLFRSMLLFWAKQPLPANYSDWQNISTQNAEEELLKVFSPYVSRQDLIQVREDIGNRGVSRLAAIPTYYWFDSTSGLIPPTPFLRVVLDCNKMSRFLKKCDGKAPLGQKIEVHKSSDHDFKIVAHGVARPIKFSCHDWKVVPEFVIGQLAEAFGAKSKNEFKKYLVEMI